MTDYKTVGRPSVGQSSEDYVSEQGLVMTPQMSHTSSYRSFNVGELTEQSQRLTLSSILHGNR